MSCGFAFAFAIVFSPVRPRAGCAARLLVLFIARWGRLLPARVTSPVGRSFIRRLVYTRVGLNYTYISN